MYLYETYLGAGLEKVVDECIFVYLHILEHIDTY